MEEPIIKSPSLEFDNLLAPLMLMCTIIYEKYGSSNVLELKHNYKESLQKNPEALALLSNIIKNCIKLVIQSLSMEYRNKLKKIYSDDGVIALIDYIIKKEIQDNLS